MSSWNKGDINMAMQTDELLKKSLELPPVERANLVDKLLSSLDKPDKTIDDLWKKEIGKRLNAYESGKMETVSVEEVLAKYKTK